MEASSQHSDSDALKAQLRDSLSPGMEIIRVESVDPKGEKLPNLVQSAEYIITLLEPEVGLERSVKLIAESERLDRERRGKRYDLRPLIEDIKIISLSKDGNQRFQLRLAARTGATGRPDEVLAELGIPIEGTRIERTHLIFEDKTIE